MEPRDDMPKKNTPAPSEPFQILEESEVPLAALHEDPDNSNTHDERNVEAIATSLRRFKQVKRLVVRKSDHRVFAGNGTLQALRRLDWPKARIQYVEGTDEECEGYAIADNQTNRLSTFDDARLAAQLQKLADIDHDLFIATGHTDHDLQDLLAHVAADVKAAGETPYVDDIDYDATPRIKPGEVYILGRHRIVCGDAYNPADHAKALAGRQATILFSDPPYGVDVIRGGGTPVLTANGDTGRCHHSQSGKKTGVRGPGGKATIGGRGMVRPRAYRPIIGDDKPFDPTPFLGLAKTVLLFGGNCFADKLPPSPHWLVWDKHSRDEGQDELSFGDCELIWTNVKGRISVKIYRHHWTGLMREGPKDEELVRRIHPTQKPVGLLKDILNDYAEPGSVVLDPFHGSGSTLIACERIGLTCAAIEIDPHYADAGAKRWSQLTGQAAVLLHENGKKETIEW